MALDVARRGHRHVHARKVVMCFFGITGMVLHLQADMLRQMGQLIAVTATTGGVATTCHTFPRILTDYLQLHHSASQAMPPRGFKVRLQDEMQSPCLNLIPL
jgi:hypothetical protein